MLMTSSSDSKAITITLPDGNTVAGESWKTTPYDVASGISSGLANTTVVAKVNGELWDLDRPVDCPLSLESAREHGRCFEPYI